MNNKMIRKISRAVLCTVLAVSVCGCGSSLSGNGSDSIYENESDETDVDDGKNNDDENGTENNSTGSSNSDWSLITNLSENLSSLIYNIADIDISFEKLNSKTISKGPDYVIGFEKYENDSYVDYIHIVSPDYVSLEYALKYFNGKTKQAIDDEIAQYGDYWSNPEDYWLTSYRIEMQRTDSYVFSFINVIDDTADADEPDRELIGYSYDTYTGEQITLKHYVTDYQNLEEIVLTALTEKIADTYDASYLYDDWQTVVTTLFDNKDVSWVATNDGLQIWFDLDTFGDVASEIISVDVTVYDYPELFDEKYYPAGKDVPGVLETDIQEMATEMMDEIVIPLTDVIDEYTYEDCVDLVEDSDYYQTYFPNDNQVVDFDRNMFTFKMKDEENGYMFLCYFYVWDGYDPEGSALDDWEYYNDIYWIDAYKDEAGNYHFRFDDTYIPMCINMNSMEDAIKIFYSQSYYYNYY